MDNTDSKTESYGLELIANWKPSDNYSFDLGYTRLHEFKETNDFGTTTDVLMYKQHEILSGFGTASMIVDKTIKHYKKIV